MARRFRSAWRAFCVAVGMGRPLIESLEFAWFDFKNGKGR